MILSGIQKEKSVTEENNRYETKAVRNGGFLVWTEKNLLCKREEAERENREVNDIMLEKGVGLRYEIEF